MTAKDQEKFRSEFKSIVYKYSEIQSSNNRLKQLHVWDKKGSHDKAILKELDVKKKIQDDLKVMLKGHDYEEWKFTSKRLSGLNLRLKRANAAKQKAEADIDNIKFKL